MKKKEFEELHHSVQVLLFDEEKEGDQYDWYEPKMA